MKKPNFIIDANNHQLIQGNIEIGEIIELPISDAAKLASHIGVHGGTIYVAASGIDISNDIGIFDSSEVQIAMEWVREETNPQPDEPECNVYRYVFGITNDSRCLGYDVTKKPETGQVAEHWTTLDNAVKMHFPDIE